MMFCQSTHKLPQPLRTDEWQREIVFVVASKHVKLFRASHSELLVLVVSPDEQFLEAQELLVNPEGLYWDTVSAKGVNSGLISDWLEAVNIVHGASLPACDQCRSVRRNTLHSREAAAACRSCENLASWSSCAKCTFGRNLLAV